MTQTRHVATTTGHARSGVSPRQRTAVILMSQLLVIIALLLLRSIIQRRRQGQAK